MYLTLINNIRLDSHISIYEPKDLPVEIDFMSGNIVNFPEEKELVYTTNAVEGDSLRDFQKGSFTLMSERFLKLLEDAGVDNVQKIPAKIVSDVDGYVWDNYFGVNVIGVITCADMDNSIYDEIMPGHYIFDELAIHPEKANGALMFRLHEHLPTIVIHRNVGVYIKNQDPDKTLIGWSVGKVIQ